MKDDIDNAREHVKRYMYRIGASREFGRTEKATSKYTPVENAGTYVPFVTIERKHRLVRRIMSGCRKGSWTRRPNLQRHPIRTRRVRRTWGGLPIGDVKVATCSYEGQPEFSHASMRGHAHKDVSSSSVEGEDWSWPRAPPSMGGDRPHLWPAQHWPSDFPPPFGSSDLGLPTGLPPGIDDKVVLRSNRTRCLPGDPPRSPRTLNSGRASIVIPRGGNRIPPQWEDNLVVASGGTAQSSRGSWGTWVVER